MSSEVLWQPSAERVEVAAMTRFARSLGCADSLALHRLSLRDPNRFWRAVWDDAGIAGDPGPVGRAFDAGDGSMRAARFFPDARLNIAENLLRAPSDEPAIVGCDETGARVVVTRAELHERVRRVSAALRGLGVQPGDTVAAWLPNGPDAVVVMLAAATIGAVFSSTSPDFGTAGVIDRFGQIDPVVLFAARGYHYGGRYHDCEARLAEITAQLPTLRATVLVEELDAFAPPTEVPLAFERLPFDHPLYVLYSSGTTGPPKCIVHRAGGILLKHASEHRYHCDVRAGDVVFYFTTCGWMMWNWLVGTLACDATIVAYDGSPFHPGPAALFDLAEREHVTLFGVGAKFLDACRNESLAPVATHDLSALRTVCSTGSPLVHEGFEYVYSHVKPDVHLASISGGTDLCGCLVLGDPTRPVHAGEIQGPALGVASDVWTDTGEPAPPGTTGELVCTRPFPSMPLGFLADPDGHRYHDAYFARFAHQGDAAPDSDRSSLRGVAATDMDVWAHGDFALRTESGGFVIVGRSDATLNPGGVRIGTAELYRQVEAIPEIAEALAIGQPWDGDVRIVLFVRFTEPELQISADLVDVIRRRVRTNCSPRHVPARIVAVADLPRTRSGKLAELAVADVVAGRTVRNREALANPECLDGFVDLPELRS